MIKIAFILSFAFISASCSVESEDKKQNEAVLYYEMNIDTMNKEQINIVDSIGKYLIDNPKVKIEVIGLAHPNEINYKNGPDGIAFKRCQNVGKYLLEKLYVDSNRISFGVEVIGPKLGEDPKNFRGPEEKEYRKVYFVFEN